jgi:lipopolysaccharide heptosyltransferase II
VSARAKVLVVGPSWVGDMVMAQALYRVLAARVPPPEIHVLAPPWSLPLITRMPEVARAIELAAGHGELKLALRRSLGRSLRAERYTEAIVLPRSFKAALVPWFARIPKRTGFRGEWRYGLLNDVRELDRDRLDQTVKRFVALGLPANAAPPSELPGEWRPRLRVDDANLARLRREHGLGDEPLVALMPGAEYGPAKRWPAPSFAALARSLAQAGRSVLLLGSAKERELGEEIRVAAASERVRNLCGATTLGDVVDLLAASDAAVSNDSGLLHVAAAAGTHVVAIYGSSSPAFTPPLTAHAAIVYRGIECSPCFARECPLGHLRCLREIEPRDVLKTVDSLLAAPRARAVGTARD